MCLKTLLKNNNESKKKLRKGIGEKKKVAVRQGRRSGAGKEESE